MSFKRSILPVEIFKDEHLTQALISIGIRLAGDSTQKIFNIEDTLFSASIDGVMDEDYRILGLLTDWIEIHGRLINVDRLSHLVRALEHEKVRRYWKAVSEWQAKDTRFKKLGECARVRGRAALLDVGSEFLVKKNGEDERFKNTALIVPNLTLRHRPSDIHAPETLSKMNVFYRFRLMIGPSYRADLWAMISQDQALSASELARLTYSSFASAWGVKRDFALFENIENKKVPA